MRASPIDIVPEQNMQLLQITRKSNDAPALVGVLLCFLSVVAFSVFAFVAKDTLLICGAFAAAAVCLEVIMIKMLRGIVVTFQNGLVVEHDQSRFGRTDQPDKQRVIRRLGVECLILDEDEPSIFVHSGKSVAPPLAPGILIQSWQVIAMAKAVQEHWPEIPVYDLEQFQDMKTHYHESPASQS